MNHRHMDQVALTYDGTIPVHVRDHYVRKRTAVILGRVPTGRILDVGCGTGLLDAALEAAGLQVIGMDESLGMLQRCRQRAVPCLCGDSSKLPFASESVDAVVCVATLHHLVSTAHIRETIQEMLRVVKPGGTVILWDHNPLNPYWPLLMRRVPQDQEPTRLVPRRELLAAFSRGDVSRVDALRLGLIPDFAPRMFLWIFQALEWIVERTPGLRVLCAHNVVFAVKQAA